MEIIIHRRNSRQELLQTPTQYGVEIDIRSYKDELIIQHEPFADGEIFSVWLKDYQHGTLVLNVKEEGLENRILHNLHQFNIEKFFFLDQSFPFLIKTAQAGERRCAVRVSEYESLETVFCLRNKVEWVWIDCFTKFPLTSLQANELQSMGFKLCIVSCELQGRNSDKDILQWRSYVNGLNFEPDAICTKLPELWI